MSKITNKLARRSEHRKLLKKNLKKRKQVKYRGRLKKKGWPSN